MTPRWQAAVVVLGVGLLLGASVVLYVTGLRRGDLTPCAIILAAWVVAAVRVERAP